MGNAISVFLADSSDALLTMLSDCINGEKDMHVIGTAQDGEETVRLVQILKPDVLVVDIMLKRLDGVGVIRKLRETGVLPRTIVISAFFNDGIAAEISRLGVDYCFPKPFRMAELLSHIREYPTGISSAYDAALYDAQITQAIISFGVMPHLQGYRYLRESIRRSLADSGALHGVTKILYPDLAKLFGTSPKCIERSMRNAIKTAWEKGDPIKRERYYGDALRRLRTKPTNTQFIALVKETITNGNDSGNDGFMDCAR